MVRTTTLFVAFAFTCFGASSYVHVEEILFASYADHSLLYIVSDKTVRYKTSKLRNPSRMYIDILNSEICGTLTAGKIEVADQLLDFITVVPSGKRTRLVLSLNTTVSERVIRLKKPPGLLVNIKKSLPGDDDRRRFSTKDIYCDGR